MSWPGFASIEFQKASAVLVFADGDRLEVAKRDLAFLGEYTTDEGPFADDWFFVIGVRGVGLFEEPMGRIRNSDLTSFDPTAGFELIGSTDYASRVCWPEELRGQEIFTVEPAGRFWRPQIRITLRQELQELIGREVFDTDCE